MKIAFLMRSDFKEKRGGDVVQVEAYCRELENMGHECKLLDNLAPEECAKHAVYILVNIDRPVETIDYWKKIKSNAPEKKIFLIPIHHPIDQINRFEKLKKGIGYKVFNILFPDFYAREKIKNLVRFRHNARLLITSISHLPISYKNEISRIIENSDGLIYISNGEKTSIENDFKVNPSKYVVAHNAVEITQQPSFIEPASRKYDVIVVGRIEPRKNQISVMQALKGNNCKVCFVGAANGNSDKYYQAFQSLLDKDSNFEYLGTRSHAETLGLIANSRMLLNASFFEVNPLVDLEAALVGTQVVTTKYSYSPESLPNAPLIDPWDLEDIRQKINSVLEGKLDTLKDSEVFESWLDPAEKIATMLPSTNASTYPA